MEDKEHENKSTEGEIKNICASVQGREEEK